MSAKVSKNWVSKCEVWEQVSNNREQQRKVVKVWLKEMLSVNSCKAEVDLHFKIIKFKWWATNFAHQIFNTWCIGIILVLHYSSSVF